MYFVQSSVSVRPDICLIPSYINNIINYNDIIIIIMKIIILIMVIGYLFKEGNPN